MEITKKIHQAWKEIEEVNQKLKPQETSINHFIGKYQYIVTHNGKKMSIIQLLKDHLLYKTNLWEVAIFDYGRDKRVEVLTRVLTLKEAKDYCKEYLKKYDKRK